MHHCDPILMFNEKFDFEQGIKFRNQGLNLTFNLEILFLGSGIKVTIFYFYFNLYDKYYF